jgi:hypothetical protein
MISNRVYYTLKPFIPWPIRIGIRRLIVAKKRRSVSSIWPILHGSEMPPQGWPGWPDGKQFAFILTHDVEGVIGHKKCHRLMELEREHGVVSSFNLIPRGAYKCDDEFRAEFQKNGFEVGVHDLHHDGKLYQAREDFMKKAALINGYVKDWGANGFRSGAMHHNLEWLHAVNVEYDASTFDTDPFEPQPDGVGTIFPFFVPHPSGSGYVELPYTLPQDSTLFLLLREQTVKIWKDKLDFVARHGGMAMVIVHPDYIQFPDEKPKSSTYPLQLFVDLLDYVKERYEGKYWNARPIDVVRYYKNVMLNGKQADNVNI